MSERAPRGRPRSERVRLAVLKAADELMAEGGAAAVTMEAIVARAGVSKATVYKWWPSCRHVMLESFFDRTRDTIAVDEDASLEQALVSQLGALADLFQDASAGPLMRDLVAAAQRDPDIRAALNGQWLAPRRLAARRLLVEALERGELRGDADIEAALDQLFAPVYHRLLFGHGPLDGGLAPVLVGQLLPGLRASAPSGGTAPEEAGSERADSGQDGARQVSSPTASPG